MPVGREGGVERVGWRRKGVGRGRGCGGERGVGRGGEGRVRGEGRVWGEGEVWGREREGWGVNGRREEEGEERVKRKEGQRKGCWDGGMEGRRNGEI